MNFVIDNFEGYVKKEYKIKFLKFFTLEVIAEDKEDGTYKHFVNIYFLNKSIIELAYKTGFSNFNKKESNFEKYIIMGNVTIKNKTYTFDDGKTIAVRNGFTGGYLPTFKSEFNNFKMSITTYSKHISEKIQQYYFKENK